MQEPPRGPNNSAAHSLYSLNRPHNLVYSKSMLIRQLDHITYFSPSPGRSLSVSCLRQLLVVKIQSCHQMISSVQENLLQTCKFKEVDRVIPAHIEEQMSIIWNVCTSTGRSGYDGCICMEGLWPSFTSLLLSTQINSRCTGTTQHVL